MVEWENRGKPISLFSVGVIILLIAEAIFFFWFFNIQVASPSLPSGIGEQTSHLVRPILHDIGIIFDPDLIFDPTPTPAPVRLYEKVCDFGEPILDYQEACRKVVMEKYQPLHSTKTCTFKLGSVRAIGVNICLNCHITCSTP